MNIEPGEIWVWTKPEGLYAGMTVKLIVNAVFGNKIYYETEFKKSKNYSKKTKYVQKMTLWDVLRYNENEEIAVNESFIYKETLIAHGFKIDSWDSWPLAEPEVKTSRLDDID